MVIFGLGTVVKSQMRELAGAPKRWPAPKDIDKKAD